MTAAERIAAQLAAREALKAAHAAAYEEQQANDLEKLVPLEDEHGFERVLRVNLVGWKAGTGEGGSNAATLVAVRIPLSSEDHFRRYEQTVSKAKPNTTTSLDAAHTLAEACLVYPSKKDAKALYDATFELAAGIRSNLAMQIVKAVQGNAEEEKKD